MSGYGAQKDGGALLKAASAQRNATATAAGSGDNTAINGLSVDLLSLGFKPEWAKLVIRFKTVLAEDKTLSITAKAEDSAVAAHASGEADYGDAMAKAVVATGGSGGSTEDGVVELDFTLGGARRYLRSVVTPDLSASGTDTAECDAVWIFGGSNVQPISVAAN